MSRTTISSGGDAPATIVDPTDHLPLSLSRSEIIPPAPNRSASSIDWLPDFSGYSWVAYGASTLLVISHFPSPLSPEEISIGPIFRQVFELCGDVSSPVVAVSWSPVTPSFGELAAASENCICIFSHDSENSKGSFCWSQNTVLVQSTKVEAVEWTGSGDGLIAGGTEVVLWKRRSRSWEVAWKFKVKGDPSQDLVSATWSIDGLLATATSSGRSQTECNAASKCVSVCYSNGKAEYAKVELRHPQPISMIQWRPLMGRELRRKQPPRHVLLTCCLDGTVRLWIEIDNGRVRKVEKEGSDQKTRNVSFCVAAAIEINQVLSGSLGTDVFLRWATQLGGIYKTTERANQFFSTRKHEHAGPGQCEWLIGLGPGQLLTFWAVHCLDDISPVRFPRISLWKRQELQDTPSRQLHLTGPFISKDSLLLGKAVMLRDYLSGPPVACSLIHLLQCNTLHWSFCVSKTSSDPAETSLQESHIQLASGVLDVDGHSGKIIQVVLHPWLHKVELAVSLDSKGVLLLWSYSSVSNCTFALPTLFPTWKLCGRLVNQGTCLKYTSIIWGPSTFEEEQILLMGHTGGIDCFVLKGYQGYKEDLVFHYMCTIPFIGHGPHEDGPTNIFSIPLPSSCSRTCENKFMLMGIWMKEFQALSWEITLHAYDLLGSSCKCNFEDSSKFARWAFNDTFNGKRYSIAVNPSSSELPYPHNQTQVSSFAVVSPSWPALENNLFGNYPAYIMVTGHSDGSLKLWKSTSAEPSTSCIPWELVGMVGVHQSSVSAISFSDCGRKIATVCMNSHSGSVKTITIWDAVHVVNTGIFLLEDTLSIEGEIVALKWSAIGNGQLLLGVCMQNEMRVYAQRRGSGQTLVGVSKPLKPHFWVCIAFDSSFSDIHDFLWGPKGMAVIIHKSYFSLSSVWLFLVDKKGKTDGYCVHGLEGVHFPMFTDSDINKLKELTTGDVIRRIVSAPSAKMNTNDDHQSSSLLIAAGRLTGGLDSMLGFWSLLDIAGKLRGPLPLYHPQALFMNIFSGNWKRAYVSLRHLAECLTSNDASKSIQHAAKSGDIVPEILLSNFFEGHLSTSSNEKGFQWSGSTSLTAASSEVQKGLFHSAYGFESDATSNVQNACSTNYELRGFQDPLDNLCVVGAITSDEKTQILAIIDLLNEVSNPHSAYSNLDESGRRFWIALRFQNFYFSQRFGRSATEEELVVDSSMIVWALHSDCQETLLGSIMSNEQSWKEFRLLGVGFWFRDAAQLRSRMEKLARQQYLKNRNPKDCALLYIALNRLQVLAGLFKISRNEKDKPLVGFLSRNFQEEKHKAAALKNAYVLMGKHQLEMAIAFFILGGDTSSAITVCARNLGDEQLALVLCRLIEGHDGQLERDLITKILLPQAIERGDYWLVSLLEWERRSYSQSFLAMIGFKGSETSIVSSVHRAFTDPRVGFYCHMLANKNTVKNAVGERNAATLGRFATLMTVAASRRSGLPLQALECLSASSTNVGGSDQGVISANGDSCILHGILEYTASGPINWLSGDVSFTLDTRARLDLALHYISKLFREHPDWPNALGDHQLTAFSKNYEVHEYEKLLQSFQHKLHIAFAQFEHRFSISSSCLISMISSCCSSRLFIGSDIARADTFPDFTDNDGHAVDRILRQTVLHWSLWDATIDISLLFSRFIVACNITLLQCRSLITETDLSSENKSNRTEACRYYFQVIRLTFSSYRAAIMASLSSSNEDVITKTIRVIFDLLEYYMHFAFAWLERDARILFHMVQPLIITYTDGHSPYEIDMIDLKKALHETIEVATQSSTSDIRAESQGSESPLDTHGGYAMHSTSEDARWQIIGACVWQHMSKFMQYKLSSMSINLDDRYLDIVLSSEHSSPSSSYHKFKSKSESIPENINLLSLIMTNSLKSTIVHVSSHHVKQLATLLEQKLESGAMVPTVLWLEESRLSQPRSLYQNLDKSILGTDIRKVMNNPSVPQMLWDLCIDPNLIFESFARENIDVSHWFNNGPSREWDDMYRGLVVDHENDEPCNLKGGKYGGFDNHEVVSSTKGFFSNSQPSPSSIQKDTNNTKEVAPFRNSKEIYKMNGELLEALCMNSIDQRQTAVASNRKGIIFFNWEEGITLNHQSHYLWSEGDWPQNGWAGSESTPVPTCVSLGVGLGSKKGTHLGLGGATVGVGSRARPGRDLTGAGALGAPGYAGIGASGLGWETQEDFEQFVDPPPTVLTISTRAFSTHPLRPLFLAGSSNTHIYLWEFGKEKATATYGVLPAANVPPPYALASISAVKFDNCGHRFASAALDGTVCTWQLEVGGRSNIHPTESSLCFNSHASDVTYVTSSGSVIAVTGYSSTGVNAVIWDTLAPPTTSQASIVCHEGGARSISVFDNDIGSGSVSPLIVTGGRNGDVGLHDFRYIATGRTKRHRQVDNHELGNETHVGSSSRHGDLNSNGMLWYIPKAHLGSVTKINTIPNTSLFLTGSKDGDVKLWDAKAAKLVYHWPKLHERHTFLQSSYSGIVRAGVTDIQVYSSGFLTCGGDGAVKLVQLNDECRMK